jgi:hypothetical protein
MSLWVANKQVTNAGIKYDIFDGTAPAGTVTVNFNKKQSWWRAQGTDGLLVNSADIRKAMYAAVRKHDASLLLARGFPADNLFLHYIST